MSSVRGLIPLFVLFGAASGCNSGFDYRPIDDDDRPLTEWSKDVAEVHFAAGQYNAVIGGKNALMFIDIDNNSDMRVVVLGGDLQTSGHRVAAHVLEDAENLKARSVPARSGFKRVMLFWQFDRPASEWLGENITWSWHVRIGPTQHDLPIRMRRQSK